MDGFGEIPETHAVRITARGRRVTAHLVMLVACVAMLVSCVGDAPDSGGPVLSAAGLARVELAAGGLVVRGKNDLRVRVQAVAADGVAEVIAATAFMPAHGHGTRAPTVETAPRVRGTYVVRNLALYMPGRWELTVVLAVNGSRDEAVLAVDVP